MKLLPDQKLIDEFSEPLTAIAVSRIECHYFKNNCFFETDNYLLENINRIRKIPGVIVTGFVVWAIAYALGRAFLSA